MISPQFLEIQARERKNARKIIDVTEKTKAEVKSPAFQHRLTTAWSVLKGTAVIVPDFFSPDDGPMVA